MKKCLYCKVNLMWSMKSTSQHCSDRCRQAAHRAKVPKVVKEKLSTSTIPCTQPRCKDFQYARGLCNKHWTRMRRYGDPTISYAVPHGKLRDLFGSARDNTCAQCSRRANVWAYMHTAEVEYRTENGAPFSMEVKDYSPLCDLHHVGIDVAHGKLQGGQAHRRHRRDIPHFLLIKPSWTRADGKRPITVEGAPASSTNRATWSTYWEVAKSKAGDGFGFMLGDGVGAYDLDHVLDGETLAEWAHDFISQIREPIIFTERSMSDTGLHIFIATNAEKGWRKNGVEFYPRNRFIRMTGNEFLFRKPLAQLT